MRVFGSSGIVDIPSGCISLCNIPLSGSEDPITYPFIIKHECTFVSTPVDTRRY